MLEVVAAVLLICAFLTLFAVLAAVFTAIVSMMLLYRLGREFERLSTELPRRCELIPKLIWQKYAKPFMESVDDEGGASAQPMDDMDILNDVTNEEGKSWLYQ